MGGALDGVAPVALVGVESEGGRLPPPVTPVTAAFGVEGFADEPVDDALMASPLPVPAYSGSAVEHAMTGRSAAMESSARVVSVVRVVVVQVVVRIASSGVLREVEGLVAFTEVLQQARSHGAPTAKRSKFARRTLRARRVCRG
jgi:hypothetical protein